MKAGRLDVHPTEQALVVYYELEAAILGEGMSKVLSDKKVHGKNQSIQQTSVILILILGMPKDYSIEKPSFKH